MKRFAMCLVLMVVAMLAAACGDSKTIESGTARECADQDEDGECDQAGHEPQMTCVDQDSNGYCDEITREEDGGVEISVQVQTCSSDDYCYETETCVPDAKLTKRFGHTIRVCDEGCSVVQKGHLGSLCYVAGSDSCQRDGNENLFCDVRLGGKCRQLTDAEVEDGIEISDRYCDAQGTEGEGEGEGAAPAPDAHGLLPGQVIMTCCYSPSDVPATWFGQFSYSNASEWTPEAWTAIRDRRIGADRCFSSEPLNRSAIVVGPWCTLTKVLEPLAAPSDWVTLEAKPTSASFTTMSGQEVLRVRYHEFGRGWRLGYIGGDDPGCSDAVATCYAPGAPR